MNKRALLDENRRLRNQLEALPQQVWDKARTWAPQTADPSFYREVAAQLVSVITDVARRVPHDWVEDLRQRRDAKA